MPQSKHKEKEAVVVNAKCPAAQHVFTAQCSREHSLFCYLCKEVFETSCASLYLYCVGIGSAETKCKQRARASGTTHECREHSGCRKLVSVPGLATTSLTSNSTLPLVGISAGQFSGGRGPGRFFPATVRFFHVAAPDLAVSTSPTRAAQSQGCSRFRA